MSMNVLDALVVLHGGVGDPELVDEARGTVRGKALKLAQARQRADEAREEEGGDDDVRDA